MTKFAPSLALSTALQIAALLRWYAERLLGFSAFLHYYLIFLCSAVVVAIACPFWCYVGRFKNFVDAPVHSLNALSALHRATQTVNTYYSKVLVVFRYFQSQSTLLAHQAASMDHRVDEHSGYSSYGQRDFAEANAVDANLEQEMVSMCFHDKNAKSNIVLSKNWSCLAYSRAPGEEDRGERKQ